MLEIVCRRTGPPRWGQDRGYWAVVDSTDDRPVGDRPLRKNSKTLKVLGRYPWTGSRTKSYQNAQAMAKQTLKMYWKKQPEEERAARILMGEHFH